MNVSPKAIETYCVYHIHAGSSYTDGYIGVTKNLSLRFTQHGWKRKQSNPHLRNALAKYNDMLRFDVLASNLEREAAELLEAMLRPTKNIGWNVAEGGNIPPNPKGRVRSSEYCANIAKAKLGANNPMFGKKLTFSAEHRQRLSKAAKLLPIVACPHCGTTGSGNGMKRWHFDGCKNARI